MDLSNLKARVNHETKNILVPRFFDMETEIDTLSNRKGLKTEVESVQLGNTYIADIDKCPQDKYVVSAMWLAQCG